MHATTTTPASAPMTDATPDALKTTLLDALRAFIDQRPGMDPRNYGDGRAYRTEARAVQRDRQDALRLLSAVEGAAGISGAALRDAFRAYAGRLSWDGTRLDYCTGQYFPTEYRRAACAVLASALWGYARERYQSNLHAADSAGDWLRRYFRREFGARLARRYFS